MSAELPGDANERFEFAFRVPKALPPGTKVLTTEEAEQDLLAQVQEGLKRGDPVQPLWTLANFYKQSGQVEKAGKVVRDLLTRVAQPEDKAYLIMSLGQLAEKKQDFELAVRFYREGVSLEPCSQFTWYFLHNNLGYSLNQLGRYEEGETWCRRAIEISPEPSNAHKNLGLALQGQGRYAEAARCFVTATQANASDGRSTRHLQDLLQAHPELQFEFGPLLEKCQQAVAVAAKEIEKLTKGGTPGWAKSQ